ncbi:MAG TPA: phosphoribosylglycinamide formyltransferase [Cryomorphaceae bacterium]|nr:phosphoribosylglycinamide formyltransferase [Cryomorphaceae bacterium]
MPLNAPKASTSLAILASGTGSNAAAIAEYFQGHNFVSIAGIWTNRPEAGIKKREINAPIHGFLPEKDETRVLAEWKKLGVEAVALAGYLKNVPLAWIEAFPGRMFNIHPALLPKFGGKGMYGLHIHRAALTSGEAFSGLTIHEVSKEYDEGTISFQCRVPVEERDTPETLQARILKAEHWAYPRVLEAQLCQTPMPNPLSCPK